MRERAHSLVPCRRGLRRPPGRGSAPLLLVVLSLLWLGPAARATSLVRLGLESMTVRAHCIAYATVEEVHARFADGAGAGGTIVTDVRLRVRRGLLGAKDGELITAQHLGGVVGEIGQIVHGEASYRVGEEVVVLLARRPGGLFAVGMSQGALHVLRDAAGVRRVHAELAGAEFVPSPAGPSERDVAPSGMPLDALLLRLADLVARHHGAQASGAPAAPAAPGAR